MRPDGRGLDQLRPTHIEINALPYAEGSALITAGDTRVLWSRVRSSIKKSSSFAVDGIYGTN